MWCAGGGEGAAAEPARMRRTSLLWGLRDGMGIKRTGEGGPAPGHGHGRDALGFGLWAVVSWNAAVGPGEVPGFS